MPSLKALRTRINSVKSTQKITSAMKMVSASKLRRAQAQAEAARPYAERMERMLRALAASVSDMPNAPALLAGTGKDQTYLLVPVTADRGLAGAFNSSIGRPRVRWRAGSKPRARRSRSFRSAARDATTCVANWPAASPATSAMPASGALNSPTPRSRRPHHRHADAGEIDVCILVYNRFRSVISQVVTEEQLIPAPPPPEAKRSTSAAPATNSSPTRRPSWRGCCRKRSPSSCIARCWKVRPASTARA